MNVDGGFPQVVYYPAKTASGGKDCEAREEASRQIRFQEYSRNMEERNLLQLITLVRVTRSSNLNYLTQLNSAFTSQVSESTPEVLRY